MTTEYDVVVAGYGPVGAVAANLLGQCGLRALVVEPTTSLYHLPRAAHHDAEIHRVYQSIGVLDDLAGAVEPGRGMHFVTRDGERLFGFDVPDTPTVHGWAPSWFFYQPDLERALRAGVERHPSIDVQLAHEVAAFVDRGAHVDVDIHAVDGTSRTTVTARWLLGCDGARSTVRKGLGVELDDYGFDQPWLVVDTVLRRPADLPVVTQQVCDPERPATFVPMSGAHRRWELMLMPGETAEEMEAPARVRELLARWVEPDDIEVIRAVVYTFHALVADRWRVGNVLLAGDAVHQMPPFLGQGMCSGIRDVANLVWKIDLVRRGLAGDSILDTYQAEREPHVRSIIELAVALGGILQTTDADVAAARDAELLARTARGEHAPAEPALPRLGPGLFHAAGEHVGRPGPQAVPDEAGWTLLTRRPAGPHAAIDRLGIRAVVVPDGWDDWLGDDGAALLRPDRYVYGTASDAAALRAVLDGLDATLTSSTDTQVSVG